MTFFRIFVCLPLVVAVSACGSDGTDGGAGSGGAGTGGTGSSAGSGGTATGGTAGTGGAGTGGAATGGTGTGGAGAGGAATGGSAGTSAGGAGSDYFLDFATAAVENPLSAGGIWSNNTQGVGGNVAPGNFTNMLVGLASDGATTIAFDSHGGVEYDDSFAFVPGFTGDQYAEAVLYKEAGYNPNAANSNHEVELILGCSSASGTRIWNEFLFNAGGGVDIVYLDGGPSDFQSIGSGTGAAGIPQDGDVIRATKVGNVLKGYLNGVLVVEYTGDLAANGSGIGIAGFIRPGATHNKFGFRSIKLGKL